MYADAQHLCAFCKARLCSFPNYCRKSGCLNLPKRQDDPCDEWPIKENGYA